MKRLGLFMPVIMILCITVNAQKQSNRTLVAYFSATGTTEKAAKQIAEVTGGEMCIRDRSYAAGFRSPTLQQMYAVSESRGQITVGDPDLDPEKSNFYNLNVEYNCLLYTSRCV